MQKQRLEHFDSLLGEGWDGFRKGVEKEGLRVDPSGFIAQTPHPRALGSALMHPRITTDYSEALLELITPVCDSTEALLASLQETHAFVQHHLGDELLWPNSMPCRIDGDASIPIAEYGSSNVGRLKHVYRQGLAVRYGRVMQSIAGLHYNFSLPESFWQRWQARLGDGQSLQDFKSEQYFWLLRNFRRRSWLLMWLFGASSALDASFVAGRQHPLRPLGRETFHSPVATSLRMGDMGYHNNAQASLDICFNRLDTYIRTLDHAIHTPWPPYGELGTYRDGQPIQINTNVLQIENEYYSAMRPKRTTRTGEKPLQALQARGVEYIEVRCLDLDPWEPLGLGRESLDFLDLFLMDCLLDDSPWIDDAECTRVDDRFRDVVAKGRQPGLSLPGPEGDVPLESAVQERLEPLSALAERLDALEGGQAYRDAVAAQRAKLEDPGLLPSARTVARLAEPDAAFLEWNLELARDHQQHLRARVPAPARMRELDGEAAQSLSEQAALEEAEDQPFEQFLASFLAN